MEKSVHTREYTVLLKLLRDTRRAAGVTQVQLAERIGESQSHLSKMERGEVRLDLIQMRTICRVLGSTLPTFVMELEKRLAPGQRQK
jgi:transcriptional regulator with XRE-family HTH domain